MGLPDVAEFARNFAVMVRVQGPVSFLITSPHVCVYFCNSFITFFTAYLTAFLLLNLGFKFPESFNLFQF